MEIVKLAVVIAAIVLALRYKAPVGITLFAAGLLAAALYGIAVPSLLDGYWQLLKSARFLSLTGVIVLVTILGALLNELGHLDRLSNACRQLYGGTRTAVAVLPFLIGLMPMPGGALLSAPLVGTLLTDPKYSPEFKTGVNYWFRHLAEPFWPIYPGVILTEAVTGMPMSRVAMMQIPLSVFMVILGTIFLSRQIDRVPGAGADTGRATLDILKSLWPIIGAILLYGVFGVNLVFSIMIALATLVVISRPSKPVLWGSLKKGLSYRLTLVVFGIMSFQTVLELSGAINSVPAFANAMHFPPWALIILVCFTLGFLTGMVAAYIGMGYALLAGFMYQPTLVPGNILLGYLAGYLGMLLSPTHLCLVLSANHFGASLGKVYRVIAIPSLILAVSGFLLSRSGWGNLFVR
jgi:integral membrane protein (TIGR00529 family)